ncbi:AhpC/TSA family protein [Flavobacterium sp. CYK-4]|uniref:TlpA disulfide reductase family protein n=1 Tax=Flavobacterium lotistagni TaxID=2709660 RepID=UPI001409C9F7|nr:TlpA disulfide reductase family protein [Flavobacterium lotistagni]NHM07390.1 AhpC/TSA family protein [Flavobacterium lotistagni]
MKKFLLGMAALAAMASCNKAAENEYIVTGNIKGIADGKSVILEVQDDNGGLKPVDTVKMKDGKFTFTGSAKEPEIYLVSIESVNGKVPFILENGEIEMTIDKDSLSLAKVTGTYNNEELDNYKQKGIAVQKKMIKFQKDNNTKMMQANKTNDTVLMNSLKKEYSKFQEEFVKQSDAYVASHPKAYISILIIEGMFNQMAPDFNKITKMYNGLDESIKKTKHGKKVKENLDKINKPTAPVAEIKIGATAPDFTAPTPDGKKTSLKQNLGKVTIVDFWASWCKPCRAENPNMVALYKEFHAKGLNIVGVSLDDEASKWKEAIAKDGLTWTHVSNLKNFEDPIANTYGIQLIPSTYILDGSGKVIAKDLRGAELKAKVASLLK